MFAFGGTVRMLHRRVPPTLARLALLLALAAGCRNRHAPAPEPTSTRDGGPIDPISVRAAELVADLHDLDPRTRNDAVEQIRGLTGRHALTEEEGIAILRALPAVPAPIDDAVDTQTAVIASLADDPRMPYLPAIEDIAADLRPGARARALALVGMIDDPTAARTFLRLLARHPDPSPSLAFAHLQQHPQQVDVLFPALLDLTTHPTLFDDITTTALAYCDLGLLTPAALASHAAPLLATYREQRDELMPAQKPTGVAWMWRDTYVESRNVASVLLDLFGCLPADVVAADLTDALTYRDPHLLYVATRSLLGHDQVPPPAVIDRIAASDETRVWLYQLLTDAGRLELFPARELTQPALAASQLAEWLAERDHLGRVPDELEPLDVVTIDAGAPDGLLDFFVFRFRILPPAPGNERGWLAGVAGPYLRSAEPTIDDHGGTYSAMEPADGKTAAEHVGDPGDIVREWRRH
jgi:hypothetical protein